MLDGLGVLAESLYLYVVFHNHFIQSRLISEISTMKNFFRPVVDVHIEGHWHNTTPS